MHNPPAAAQGGPSGLQHQTALLLPVNHSVAQVTGTCADAHAKVDIVLLQLRRVCLEPPISMLVPKKDQGQRFPCTYLQISKWHALQAARAVETVAWAFKGALSCT
eukprot:1158066-Pelagomonas_calceolata.AAC.7